MERFSISMEDDLLEKFDRHLSRRGYSNRSEAVRDLVRKTLVDEEWESGEEVVGVITLVFDHHQRQLQEKLTEIQHDHCRIIISSTHVHLDHHNCLEVIIVKGDAGKVRELADRLKAPRGVKSSELTATTTGRRL
ncbi:MAG: CopG family transcriptional regulator, nickel-responsive regulator [Verrucomicrobiota bacterium]|jgi:CopG family nickel-responsive transcriptional regulator|nr:CopG family transcriptional regulator, nickel-responsive regulator [Verrucomicrobiota bacterium]